jgi:hypothetical protein
VAAVRTLHGTDAVEKSGLGVSPSKLGWIPSIWALFQSFMPVLTGGLSDRYGDKENPPIHGREDLGLSGDGFLPLVLAILRGRAPAQVGHGHLQTRHPGHTGQVDYFRSPEFWRCFSAPDPDMGWLMIDSTSVLDPFEGCCSTPSFSPTGRRRGWKERLNDVAQVVW